MVILASPAAVLFPGQGAQVLGMGLDIAAQVPEARAVFEHATEVLGRDLRAILSGNDKAALDRTDVCQLAILVTSLATMAALEARGLVAREQIGACAGLSLGEYTALTWADALEFEDALRLVAARGQAMQRASEERPSGMLSLVGADLAAATALCDAARQADVLVVANRLAPGQLAIAGTREALERAGSLAREHGIRKVVPLSVAGAFHSPCMESAAATLAQALADTPIRRPRVPVVMNVSGQPCAEPREIRALLERQIVAPVLWQSSMEWLLAAGVTRFFEPAPGKQLTNMLRRYDPAPALTTCETWAELEAFAPWPGDSP